MRRWPRLPKRSQRGPFRAIVSKAPLGLVQFNHEGSRAANHVPKLEQSRAGCRYNRIRRRLLQPIKTSRQWRIVSKRRYACRRW